VALRDKLFTYLMPSAQDTTGAKGTGLGLAVAAYFVRVNGGKIYLMPDHEAQMTHFCIELPTSPDSDRQIERVTLNFSR